MPDQNSAGNADNNPGGSGDNNNQQQAPTFDSWFASQDETTKKLLEGHTAGLRNALTTERESRKGLEKQVRDLASKAEKGSESEKQLTDLADKINAADQRNEFYEAAHAAGVSNLKLAYLVAKEEDLFNKHGQVDFKAMRERFPELFGGAVKKAPAGNAGSGTDKEQTPAKSMNAFIRAAAGRNQS